MATHRGPAGSDLSPDQLRALLHHAADLIDPAPPQLSPQRVAQPGPITPAPWDSSTRRARRWVLPASVVGGVAAAILATVVAVNLGGSGNRHPAATPAVTQHGTGTPSLSTAPTATPSTRVSAAPPPTSTMPGLVQVAAVARTTSRHLVVFTQQCAPCVAKTGTYHSWVSVTDNAGATWTTRRTDIPLNAATGLRVAFADAANGWTGTGYVTHDGGLTWHPVASALPIQDVAIDGQTVWALSSDCGAGSRSCDTKLLTGPASGNTLTPTSGQPLTGQEVSGLLAARSGTVYLQAVTGTGTQILVSSNHGATWTRSAQPCPGGSAFISGAITAGDPHSPWLICDQTLPTRSTDSGRNWTQPSGRLPEAADLTATSANTAWGFSRGLGIVYRSSDAGRHWRTVWTAPADATNETVEAFIATSNTTADIFSAVTSHVGTYLHWYTTSDAGRSWHVGTVSLPK